MRGLQLAFIAAMMVTAPSASRAQDDGPVGGRVGPNLESSPGGTAGSMVTAPYQSPTGSGPRAGYAGAVVPGQVVPRDVPVIPRMGGKGTAFVGGHRVLVDPNSNRILRVIN